MSDFLMPLDLCMLLCSLMLLAAAAVAWTTSVAAAAEAANWTTSIKTKVESAARPVYYFVQTAGSGTLRISLSASGAAAGPRNPLSFTLTIDLRKASPDTYWFTNSPLHKGGRITSRLWVDGYLTPGFTQVGMTLNAALVFGVKGKEDAADRVSSQWVG
jgi:hypothetical protein